MKTVVIFGGSGFVGRHIVRILAKNGHKIVIPHQTQVNESKLRILGTTGQIIPIRYKYLQEKKIYDLIENADTIINLKTMWDENKISFKKSILGFNMNLVKIMNKFKNKSQFIFFSGLGVDQNNDSSRSDAIYQSEKYIADNLKNSIIIRPGIIIGGGDKFIKGLIPIYKVSFFIPLFGDGLSRFQPVFIDDILVAVNKIMETNYLGNHIFEFTGNNIFNYKELYNYIAECLEKTRVLVPIPFIIIKTVVRIIEKTPFSPLNSEQLKLFEKDNIASNKHKKLSDLEIFPQDLKMIIKNAIEQHK